MNASTLDHVLLERWRAREDAEAFRELVQRHGGMVFATCRRIVGDHALAEDLTQESFLRLAKAGRETGTQLAAWLHKVATNGAISALRARGRRARLETVAREPLRPEESAHWREVEARIDAAIAALDAPTRELVVAHYLEGHSHAELAEALKIPRRTISHRIQVGVEAIRRKLRRDGIDVEHVGLAGLLVSFGSKATPLALGASLAKIALAGHAPLSALATVGAAKSVAIVAAAIVVLVTGALLLKKSEPGKPRELVTALTLEPGAKPDEPVARTPDARTVVEVPTVTEPTPPPRDAASSMVTGVVRTLDGIPFAGAEVLFLNVQRDDRFGIARIDDGLLARTTSGKDGTFTLSRPHAELAGWAIASAAGVVSARAWVRASTDDTPAEPVVLELVTARTLTGRLLTTTGGPVADAIVTITQAWSEADHVDVFGATRTRADGTFELGLGAEATGCDLRIDSVTHGRDFFFKVALDGPVELVWHARTSLRGTVHGVGSIGADKPSVIAEASLPDAPVPVFRTGMQPRLMHETVLADDGSYLIDDLQPGMEYRAYVVAAAEATSPDGLQTFLRRTALTARDADAFTAIAGATVERDFELAAAITVRGTVRTSISRQPAAGLRIETQKDGKSLWDAYAETDEHGEFTLRLVAGSGEYRFRAEGEGASSRADDAFLARHLVAGEDTEIELLVTEPIVWPIRVLDADGAPVESVQSELSVESVSGPGGGIGRPYVLDAEGRTRIWLFRTAKALRLTVSRFPRGPDTTTARIEVSEGLTLPELTIRLHRAADVQGRIVDAQGLPIGEVDVRIVARYDDGGSDSEYARTDRDGDFSTKSAVRAERARFTLRIDEKTIELDARLPDATPCFALGEVTSER